MRIALGALLSGTIALAGTACTTLGGDPVPVPQPAPAQQPAGQWTVDSREHVDLWLHSFALLESDSNRVPFFRRGYRDSVLAARKRASVMSMIDANRQLMTPPEPRRRSIGFVRPDEE